MSHSLHMSSNLQTNSHKFSHITIPTFFPTAVCEKKKHTASAEVITEHMTVALLGWLFLLTDVQWAPRLATKTV